MTKLWILCSVVLYGIGLSSTLYLAFQQVFPVCPTVTPVTLSIQQIMDTADARMGIIHTPTSSPAPYPTLTPRTPIATVLYPLTSIPPTGGPLDISAIRQTATTLAQTFSRTSTPTERGFNFYPPTSTPTRTIIPPTPNSAQRATGEAMLHAIQMTATALTQQINLPATYIPPCATATLQP